MEFQHVNVKLRVKDPEEINLEFVIPVFHGWIQDQTGDELLLDVADYRHVRSGPGMVLIGHEGNYSLDNTDDRLGVRYNRKAPLDGNNQDRLTQATEAALRACLRLESDPRLAGTIRFNGQEMEVFINDRLLAPNSDATRDALEGELHTFLSRLLADGDYALTYPQDPRRLFSVRVTTSQIFEAAALLNNLYALAPASQPQ
jgi:hypothetical protein